MKFLSGLAYNIHVGGNAGTKGRNTTRCLLLFQSSKKEQAKYQNGMGNRNHAPQNVLDNHLSSIISGIGRRRIGYGSSRHTNDKFWLVRAVYRIRFSSITSNIHSETLYNYNLIS